MPKGIVTKVLNTIKNLGLSKVDKALRNAGLEDENGQPTKAARVLVTRQFAEEAWAEQRVAIGKQLVAASKKGKKDADEDDEDDE